MVFTVRDYLNDNSILSDLSIVEMPEWVNPLDYDPVNDHHPDNLDETLAMEEFIRIVWDAIDGWKSVVWELQFDTAKYLINTL